MIGQEAYGPENAKVAVIEFFDYHACSAAALRRSWRRMKAQPIRYTLRSGQFGGRSKLHFRQHSRG
jgi:hypothetical protein